MIKHGKNVFYWFSTDDYNIEFDCGSMTLTMQDRRANMAVTGMVDFSAEEAKAFIEFMSNIDLDCVKE